jgi:hypothetical protein
VANAADRLDLLDGGAIGMADVILRRTAMPAVVLELGAPHRVAMRTAGLGEAVQESLARWLTLSGE